jgi:hypothetical protein
MKRKKLNYERIKTTIHVSKKVLRETESKVSLNKDRDLSRTNIIEVLLFDKYKEYLKEEDRKKLEDLGMGELAEQIKSESKGE